MPDGLFVGRFQPFHRGHLWSIKFALERVSILYIGVGSADKSHAANNPFTAGERIGMIKTCLNQANVDCRRWLVIPIPDSHSHGTWVTNVQMLVPHFDMVFSNDPLTARLFSENEVQVIPVPLMKRPRYSGTEIRRRIREGSVWENLLPPPIPSIIKETRGVERIMEIGS
ncbi:nicotinamide-nucleotide adenylyltransferase [Candidatus Bathyarchaeota archaeon]|mgnify:CR=1 FL=1|jgi:nicotinamide-nucleotide adenylyltransferase|nr:nicotinamide-nucleotide adenylyltransferase [Nitrososphaerota archaeon]MBQ04267.1 nicotinamide-nucleotide adenylyltransferase [Candidatus Bathyarchaeota archaeon]